MGRKEVNSDLEGVVGFGTDVVDLLDCVRR